MARLSQSAAATQRYAPPVPWALGFSGGSRMVFACDVNGDGKADMVAVFPDGHVDVSLTVDGTKAGVPFTALSTWGSGLQAAAIAKAGTGHGVQLAAVFEGRHLRVAEASSTGSFGAKANWPDLPAPLDSPAMTSVDRGNGFLVFSTRSGAGYRLDSTTGRAVPCRVPQGTVWVGDAFPHLVGQDSRGRIYELDRETLAKVRMVGQEAKDSRPAAADQTIAFADTVWTPNGSLPLPSAKLPAAASVKVIGDFEGSGANDVLEFRYGSELHTGSQILITRDLSKGETFGRTAQEIADLKLDPRTPDTASDGLWDSWKLHGYRGLDLKTMGCDPRHADVICLVSRFSSVSETKLKSEMDRVIKFYAGLNVPNPDGKPGIAFHPIYLPPVMGDDMKNPWWVNRDKFRPAKWRGVVHWIQVTPGGGGQADELGDGGSVAEGALWAVFVHEFGHELGLNHEGFWTAGSSPIYTSLMNYNYSYGFEDSRDKIHYSDGSLSGLVLKETDLNETLPFPYDQVKFLSMGPYHFRLKPNGKSTLIDWNWDGVFGEKHVRADINYAYATEAGTRDTIGKTETAPWLFAHQGRAFEVNGEREALPDPKTDPTIGMDRPGKLVLHRMIKPFQWEDPWILDSGGLEGDPVAASFRGKIWTFYQTAAGVVMRKVSVHGRELSMTAPEVIVPDRTAVPTLGLYRGGLYLFLWNPVTGIVEYRMFGPDGKVRGPWQLDVKSTNPVGFCEDGLTGEAIVGLAQNQGSSKTNRWQIRRYTVAGGLLNSSGGQVDWVEGPTGGSRGTGRVTLLFDKSRDAGPQGRVWFFCRGMTSKDNPWSCTYVAMQIADKSVHGGWLVRRYYDEWTQTRSAPAAAWFGGDIIWAYRWVDVSQGSTDNNLQIGYQASGIHKELMGDFDDLGFIRTFGLRNSILYLVPPSG